MSSTELLILETGWDWFPPYPKSKELSLMNHDQPSAIKNQCLLKKEEQ